MQNYRISLNDLPPEGKEFHLDDPAIWQEPMQEFGMDCRVSKALSATIYVLPTDGGWLVRGTLAGEVVLPCSRCAEDSSSPISARFEDFEEMAADDDDEGPGGGANLSGAKRWLFRQVVRRWMNSNVANIRGVRHDRRRHRSDNLSSASR